MKLIMRREIRMGDEYKLEIIVDGKSYGKILSGEKEIELNPGNHEVFVKSLFWKSPVYQFELIDKDVKLVCGLAKINKGIKSSLLDPIIKPGNTYTVMDYEEYEKQ